ncbi:MAG: hypothetical protein QM779_11565 [Propionicimonas sp.]|uniref:WapI family immunity protein n=1 Tax=Propionicimonas sp. TaxID=1955623 RepID=UPI003D0AD869
MLLQSLDGLFVDIEVSSYQFGLGQSRTDLADWDANWLMIHGRVWDGVESWEFLDPCMTTWEARELAVWLRGLGSGHPATTAPTDPEDAGMWLTEPNLEFRLAAASEGITTLDVDFGAESRPPGCSSEDHEGLGHRVRLTIPQIEIDRAVSEWEADLRAFPPR